MLALLRQITADPPFLKEHSKKGDAWESIATALCATGDFDDCGGVDATGKCHPRYQCTMEHDEYNKIC